MPPFIDEFAQDFDQDGAPDLLLREPDFGVVVAFPSSASSSGHDYLLIADKGHYQRVPIGNPKRTIRIAVGQPYRRSSVWRFWANPNADDVYVATRTSAAHWKVSLHASGDWRMQWVSRDPSQRGTSQFHGPSRVDIGERALAAWRRPDRAPGGWLHALSILIPHEDIRLVSDSEREAKKFRWLQRPGVGRLTELRCFLVEPEHSPLNVAGAMRESSAIALVDAFVLSGGEIFAVFATTPVVHADLRTEVNQMREHDRLHRSADFDTSPELGPRFAPMVTSPSGTPEIWDLHMLTPFRRPPP
jgi:hypothetical protein